MKLYESEDQFDPKTGKPIAPDWTVKEQLCDYCGEPVKHLMDRPWCLYVFDYANMDPCWRSEGEENAFSQKYPLIDIATLLESESSYGGPYVICAHCKEESLEEYASLLAKDPVMGWESFCRMIRIRTADRLLESDRVEIAQMSGYIGDD